MSRIKARRPRKHPGLATTKDIFEVVSLQDPAIDIIETDVDAWQATLDPQYIALIEDKNPAIISLRALTDAEHDRCYIAGAAACDEYEVDAMGAADSRAQCLKAFELGVIKIEGKLKLSPAIRSEIGGVVLCLTNGDQFDLEWRESLGKSSWLDLWRVRRSSALKKQDSEETSTAPDAVSDSPPCEDADETPSASESEKTNPLE